MDDKVSRCAARSASKRLVLPVAALVKCYQNAIGEHTCSFSSPTHLIASQLSLRVTVGGTGKGCVMIACWGVPGRSYSDNGNRCLAAAVEIHASLSVRDMKTSMGITTGHVSR